MNYRVIVHSDRTEDRVTDCFYEACDLAQMISDDFGYVDVQRNLCGPEPTLATYIYGRPA